MLALRSFNTRTCLGLSRKLPSTLLRLCHEDSKTAENPKHRVYSGALRRRLRWVKLLSMSSSVVFLALTPSVCSKLLAKNSGALGLTAAVGISLMAISTPLLLQAFTRGYVVELRYEPQTKVFEADTFNIFGRTKTISFTADDVAFPTLLGPVTNLTIKNKAYLIEFDNITDPDAFDCIMKYDQPVDLILESDPKTEDKQ